VKRLFHGFCGLCRAAFWGRALAWSTG
jgi:hypothetical protein